MLYVRFKVNKDCIASTLKFYYLHPIKNQIGMADYWIILFKAKPRCIHLKRFSLGFSVIPATRQCPLNRLIESPSDCDLAARLLKPSLKFPDVTAKVESTGDYPQACYTWTGGDDNNRLWFNSAVGKLTNWGQPICQSSECISCTYFYC